VDINSSILDQYHAENGSSAAAPKPVAAPLKRPKIVEPESEE
jgi:hypothetical protein